MDMPKKTAVALLTSLFTLTLSGCATYEWVNPAKSPEQLKQDKYQCNFESSQAYPAAFKTTYTPVYQSEADKKRDRELRRVPPQPITNVVDANEDNREKFFNQCMEVRGWSLEKVKD